MIKLRVTSGERYTRWFRSGSRLKLLKRLTNFRPQPEGGGLLRDAKLLGRVADHPEMLFVGLRSAGEGPLLRVVTKLYFC